MLDPDSPEESYLAQRLHTEPIAWLGSIRPDGRPHQVPVWFAWDDPIALVFSPPTAQKVRNLRANPACTLAPETAAGGDDVVILEARAQFPVPEDAPGLARRTGFVAKYTPRLGEASFDDWLPNFAQPIVLQVDRVLGWSKPEGQLWFRDVR